MKPLSPPIGSVTKYFPGVYSITLTLALKCRLLIFVCTAFNDSTRARSHNARMLPPRQVRIRPVFDKAFPACVTHAMDSRCGLHAGSPRSRGISTTQPQRFGAHLPRAILSCCNLREFCNSNEPRYGFQMLGMILALMCILLTIAHLLARSHWRKDGAPRRQGRTNSYGVAHCSP
jgi:hypothetical protein